jgi:protein kinase A
MIVRECNPSVLEDIGAFGNVRVTWVKGAPQHKYAIKTMKKADIIKSKHVDHIENEKKILERIEHPFVVITLK